MDTLTIPGRAKETWIWRSGALRQCETGYREKLPRTSRTAVSASMPTAIRSRSLRTRLLRAAQKTAAWKLFCQARNRSTRESHETGGRNDGNERSTGRKSRGSGPRQPLARDSWRLFSQPRDFESRPAIHHRVPDCRASGRLGDLDLRFSAETHGCVAGLRGPLEP